MFGHDSRGGYSSACWGRHLRLLDVLFRSAKGDVILPTQAVSIVAFRSAKGTRQRRIRFADFGELSRAEPRDGNGKYRSLEERVLDLLAGGAVLTRAKLRDSLGVKNERLGEALEALERAGRLGRTPAGWQRLD
jgi:hypothetical protein